jgi:hypothetical protein
MMTAETAIQSPISTLDAIWAIISSQSKATQRQIAKRLDVLLGNTVAARKTAQQKYVRDTLSSAFQEVRDAERNGCQLPDAHELLDILDE